MTIAPRVAAFNDWAKAQDWPAFCDPDLAFESETLTDLLVIWRRQAGSDPIPPRSKMDVHVLKRHLGHIAIFERAAERYRARLVGTRLAQMFGEMQGKFLDEVIPAALLPRWHHALGLTLSERCALRFVVDAVEFRKLDFLRSELLLVPLLDDGVEPTLVLAGARLKVNLARAGAASA
ncbi:MAG: PAS domain-containing protein [Alphaproteobacteria bacterium]|nr:PAS domain-containing protein [Alphaproteobacteria bacterium]MDE2631182.1 PAS domain-containing protein [Alphaproteobacteria bacterium]